MKTKITDKMRLDWLIKSECWVDHDIGEGYRIGFRSVKYYISGRQAIDAAMREEKKRK